MPVDAFAGLDWMEVISDGFSSLENLTSGGLSAYNAYTSSDPYIGITTGGTWYIDGEDVKFGASITYAPQSVSPNWTTPQIGIRTTPAADMYVLRTYFQLLF